MTSPVCGTRCRKKSTRAPNKWKSAPNQGRFVLDTAGIIEPTTEDRVRRLSRALYWEREPQVPIMVFTTRALTGGQSVDALVNAMELQRHPTQWQVLVLAVDEPRELHLHIGDSWSERERRYLISSLTRIETQSLQAQGLSKTLELIAQKVAFIVRQKSVNRPASQNFREAQGSTAQ